MDRYMSPIAVFGALKRRGSPAQQYRYSRKPVLIIMSSVAGRSRLSDASISDTFDCVACPGCIGSSPCHGDRIGLKPSQKKPSHAISLSGRHSGSS